MPRIAASFIAVATVVFSIGFNTIRYPVVWEMAAPARLAGLEGSLPQKASSLSTTPLESDEKSIAEASKASAAATASIGGDEAVNTFEAASFPQAVQEQSPEPATESAAEAFEKVDSGLHHEERASEETVGDEFGDVSTEEPVAETPPMQPYASDAENPLAHLGEQEDMHGVASEGASEIPAPGMIDRGSSPCPASSTPLKPVTSARTEEISDKANAWPAEVAPSRRYAVSMADDSPVETSEGMRPLVPVPPRDAREAEVAGSDPIGTGENSECWQVERIPPIGSTPPVSQDFLGELLPSYPGTGF